MKKSVWAAFAMSIVLTLLACNVVSLFVDDPVSQLVINCCCGGAIGMLCGKWLIS